MARKITREDVAREAGVSVATVSMALRDVGRVRQETRERVRRAARRLGYHPNVAASLLARQRTVPDSSASTLRAVMLSETGFLHEDSVDGFREIGIELVWRRPSDFASPRAASRQLWNEGIDGLVLNPNAWSWSESETTKFEWERFSVVKFTRALPEVPVHCVRHSAFDYADETIRNVVDAGYRRLAVQLTPSTSQKDNDARLGAVLKWREQDLPEDASIDCISGEEARDWDRVEEWVRTVEPDVFVALHWSAYYRLRDRGWTFPDDLPIAAILSATHQRRDAPEVAGCDLRPDEVAHRMALALRDLIGRGERGFPVAPNEQVVEPVWLEGETMPNRSNTGAAARPRDRN